MTRSAKNKQQQARGTLPRLDRQRPSAFMAKRKTVDYNQENARPAAAPAWPAISADRRK
jgi:hypothetical protein